MALDPQILFPSTNSLRQPWQLLQSVTLTMLSPRSQTIRSSLVLWQRLSVMTPTSSVFLVFAFKTILKVKVLVTQSCPTLCDPVDYSLSDYMEFYPWNSLGKDKAVGHHSLLQGIFSTQGLNQGLLHCRQILYHLSHQGRFQQLFSSVQLLCCCCCCC